MSPVKVGTASKAKYLSPREDCILGKPIVSSIVTNAVEVFKDVACKAPFIVTVLLSLEEIVLPANWIVPNECVPVPLAVKLSGIVTLFVMKE